MTNKRGPKSQTLIMVPLAELVSKLPASGNVKLSRVWYEEIQKTLGFVKLVNESLGLKTPKQESSAINGIPVTDSGTIIEDKILVESLDLSDE